jgi:hypothetical protein
MRSKLHVLSGERAFFILRRKKMKMKRIVSLLLAAALVCVLFAGCAVKNDDETKKPIKRF